MEKNHVKIKSLNLSGTLAQSLLIKKPEGEPKPLSFC